MTEYYRSRDITLYHGDCRNVLATLPDQSVHCCVTSPPYYALRDYHETGQIGLEATPEDFVSEMVAVFREVRRVLRDDGTLWLNLGDSYVGSWGAQGRQGSSGQMADRAVAAARQKSAISAASIAAHPHKASRTGSIRSEGLKPKDLMGIPWRVAFALQADGWYLRQDIIWHKPNPMPESCRDRCTKSHEYLFLLSKSPRYYYDQEAIREPCAGIEDRPIFRGGAYCGNATRDNTHGGTGTVTGNCVRVGKQRAPAGWDQGKGAHGAFHRDGRAPEIVYSESARATRNKRSVWTIASQPYHGAHFATFPPALASPCILAGCPLGGVVLDPFCGTATTGQEAVAALRMFVGIEISESSLDLALQRLRKPPRHPRPPDATEPLLALMSQGARP